MITFEGFCAYARLDAPVLEEAGECAAAWLCFNAAIETAKNAGVKVEEAASENSAYMELYVYSIALHLYENRGFMNPSSSYSGDEYAKRMMAKMKNDLR